ncbi:MAG: amino acid permease [Actinomycetota bacterium]|nr:amino acid permease [Actinomycetota bacterium]
MIRARLAAKQDQETLASFGYQQDLRRSLRFFALFGVSFSVISITTGIFLAFGSALSDLGPVAIWEWLLVGAGQIVIALVVAELGARMPLAGYAYQWGSRLGGSRYGWFVGFFGLLYMSVGGGAIFLLIGSPLLLSEFGVTNPTKLTVLIVTLVIMIIPIVVNIVSVSLAAKVNTVAVLTEIVGTVFFGLLLFILWAIHYKPSPYHLSILTTSIPILHQSRWYQIVMASILGTYTLVGFEMAADMAEEAIDARNIVPKAVITAVVVSVVLGFVALVGFVVAIPSIAGISKANVPLLAIAKYWLPSPIVKLFVGFVVFSMFSISVIGTAAQSRLVYALARDNMMPFSKPLARVSSKTQTPVVALLSFGVVDYLFTIVGYFQKNTFATLIGATAIIPFIIYLMIAIAYWRKRGDLPRVEGGFSLGKFAPVVLLIAIIWSVAAILSLSVPSSFRFADVIVLASLVLAVGWYWFALRHRLDDGVAGVDVKGGNFAGEG